MRCPARVWGNGGGYQCLLGVQPGVLGVDRTSLQQVSDEMELYQDIDQDIDYTFSTSIWQYFKETESVMRSFLAMTRSMQCLWAVS